MSGNAIELHGVSKRYGSFQALYPLDLMVPYGTVFGYLGPNGAGKTTTIRIMTGLLRPTTGSVSIGGLNIHRHSREARRLFSYIPDQGYLYPKMTARELLSFVNAVHDRNSPDPRAIEAALDLVGLRPWADELIEQYSYGMRQRLMFAMAHLRDTPVWIIDEPIIGLDPLAVRMVKTWVRQKAARGHTVFLSTHLLAIAEEVCDTVAVLHQGRLVAVGT
ncbi:MAG: ABC transporter ATP-binding protein, partial [Acidobacteriota bacterium]|nr:ABC transporter ATP-binding protein [Acidobacteriota bacterium]